jgi:FkbM family methyltransferase
MLIKSLIKSFLRPGGISRRARGAEDETKAGRVEDLPGFNKLVRGRHGLFVANENDTYIGRALIAYGEFSELEWTLLQRYCLPGHVVVEVGANIGAHTVSIAQAVGPSGHVVAIEPQPVVFQTLCANLALNCVLNVAALNCGCAASARALTVPAIDYAKEGNFGGIALGAPGTGPSIAIRCESLDTLLQGLERVDFIKIDVEGMEHDVLAGATRVIGRFKPVMYIENDRARKSKSLIEQVHALGYRAWWHVPPLYNPDNHYGNAHDLYPGIGSFNMLCLPVDDAARVPPGLREVSATEPHPLAA